jgi:hypothetical protein
MAEAISVFFMNPPEKLNKLGIDVRRRKSRGAVQLRCQQLTACFAKTLLHWAGGLHDDSVTCEMEFPANQKTAFCALPVTFS